MRRHGIPDFAGMKSGRGGVRCISGFQGQDDDSGGVLPMHSSVCRNVTIIFYNYLDSSDNNSLDQAKQVLDITTTLIALSRSCRLLPVIDCRVTAI